MTPWYMLHIVHVTGHKYLMFPHYVIPYIFFIRTYEFIEHTRRTHVEHVHDLFSKH